MLSVNSIECLHAAGWFLGRKIDTSKYEAGYAAEGYPVNLKVIQFLQEFGGLSLEYPHFRSKGSMDGCDFFAEEVCRWKRMWLRDYEENLKQTLYPIGHAFSDHMLLVMSDDGEVYAFFESQLCKIGTDGVDAINTLCEGKEHECWDVEPAKIKEQPGDQEAVRKRLIDAGWFEGRGVDIREIRKHLQLGGYGISDEADRFLKEYAGLRVVTEPGGVLDVDPVNAMSTLRPAEVRELLERMGSEFMTPLAVISLGEITIVMDSKGQVFGVMPGCPDWVVSFGEEGRGGIEGMVLGRGE